MSGLTLLELMVTVLIITVLAGASITLYIGFKDKAKRAAVLRTADAARSELHHWLQSSLSQKTTGRDVDTDFSGSVDMNDSINGALMGNVASLYIAGRTAAMQEMSPWFNIPLWNSNEPPLAGTISLVHLSPSRLRLTATEKNGAVLADYIIAVE
ncbi:MAG: prepilin-type N-terminal cleavage/methylation domain-containing protein [Nitrospiraceae bacterium]|nr:MAG: prepilin-type N-terminal cleavage/methylation domain-containing protein [Nitrospiraceae bacterium]